jgi:hypothetical protein
VQSLLLFFLKRIVHTMVVGHPYVRPKNMGWNAMFAVFFVLGGVCSTLIPLTYGSRKHSIGESSRADLSLSAASSRSSALRLGARSTGRYMSSPVNGKSAEELQNTAPEDLGLQDLPPAVRC